MGACLCLFPPVRAVGVPWSKRAQALAEEAARKFDESSALLLTSSLQLRELVGECIVAHEALAALVVAHEETVEDPEEAKKGGAITAQLKQSYAEKGISNQKYWNGTLVGNDCRKLCKHHRDILTQIQDKIDSTFPNGVPGDPEASRLAASFKKRHGDMLECLRVIGHLSRKVSMLTEAELGDLEQAVNNFEKAWIAAYPEHPLLTPKAQVTIDLVVKFARHYGTLGIFGEDGLEALHPCTREFERW